MLFAIKQDVAFHLNSESLQMVFLYLVQVIFDDTTN